MNPALSLTRPPSQELLARLLADRAAWVRNAPAGDPAETTTLVLLRAVDLADLVHGAQKFAAGLTEEQADAWRRSWTKTRFLFGNPANLPERTSARVIARGGSAAWLGPFPSARPPGPSRLLKPVTGVLPELPPAIEFPRAKGARVRGPYREIHIALRDLTLAEYLVHLHHTLAESVLRGRLRPGEPLRLIHRPDLDTRAAHGEPGYARVHYAHGGPPSLRLYAWLSPAEHS